MSGLILAFDPSSRSSQQRCRKRRRRRTAAAVLAVAAIAVVAVALASARSSSHVAPSSSSAFSGASSSTSLSIKNSVSAWFCCVSRCETPHETRERLHWSLFFFEFFFNCYSSLSPPWTDSETNSPSHLPLAAPPRITSEKTALCQAPRKSKAQCRGRRFRRRHWLWAEGAFRLFQFSFFLGFRENRESTGDGALLLPSLCFLPLLKTHPCFSFFSLSLLPDLRRLLRQKNATTKHKIIRSSSHHQNSTR